VARGQIQAQFTNLGETQSYSRIERNDKGAHACPDHFRDPEIMFDQGLEQAHMSHPAHAAATKHNAERFVLTQSKQTH
jgi:hypothetical protein